MSADENIIQQQGAGPCFEKQIAVIGIICATMGVLEKPSQGFTPTEQPRPSHHLQGHGQEAEPKRCQSLVETPFGILVLGKIKAIFVGRGLGRIPRCDWVSPSELRG